jgi:hypothetical protein
MLFCYSSGFDSKNPETIYIAFEALNAYFLERQDSCLPLALIVDIQYNQ